MGECQTGHLRQVSYQCTNKSEFIHFQIDSTPQYQHTVNVLNMKKLCVT